MRDLLMLTLLLEADLDLRFVDTVFAFPTGRVRNKVLGMTEKIGSLFIRLLGQRSEPLGPVMTVAQIFQGPARKL